MGQQAVTEIVDRTQVTQPPRFLCVSGYCILQTNSHLSKFWIATHNLPGSWCVGTAAGWGRACRLQTWSARPGRSLRWSWQAFFSFVVCTKIPFP